MKVIFAPFGSHGDNRPVAAFGTALRNAGHQVVVCSTPENGPLFERCKIDFRPVGIDFNIFLKQQSDVMKNPLRILQMVFNGAMFKLARDFVPVIENEVNGASVIAGTGLQCMASSVAALHNIPYRHVLHAPAALPSRFQPPIIIPWRNLPIWLNSLLWKSDNLLASRIFPLIFNPYRTKNGLPPVTDFWRFFIHNMIISSNNILGPIPPDVQGITLQTGYWHFDEDVPVEPDLETFLQEGPPPLFIGFGSMTDPKPQKTMRLLLEVLRQLNLRAIISRGWADYLQQEDSSSIFCAGPLPHDKIFPRVAAVIHHGGAGTTHTAARAGVPQVLIPHLLDQFYWAGRIRKLGIGATAIPRHHLTIKRLVTAIRDTVDNPEIRKNAVRLGVQLRSENGVKAAVTSFEREFDNKPHGNTGFSS